MDLMQVHNLLDVDRHLKTLREWKAERRGRPYARRRGGPRHVGAGLGRLPELRKRMVGVLDA